MTFSQTTQDAQRSIELAIYYAKREPKDPDTDRIVAALREASRTIDAARWIFENDHNTETTTP